MCPAKPVACEDTYRRIKDWKCSRQLSRRLGVMAGSASACSADRSTAHSNLRSEGPTRDELVAPGADLDDKWSHHHGASRHARPMHFRAYSAVGAELWGWRKPTTEGGGQFGGKMIVAAFVANHTEKVWDMTILGATEEESESKLSRSTMGFRRGQQPNDLLYSLHRIESRARSLGETLLLAKMGVTKAFDATDLRTAYQGARHCIGEKAAYLLITEHWAGNHRFKVPGDHPDRPAVKKHKGRYQGASSSPNLFMYTVEAHVWKRWDEMAETHNWDIATRHGRVGPPYVGGPQRSDRNEHEDDGGRLELREAAIGEGGFQDRGRRRRQLLHLQRSWRQMDEAVPQRRGPGANIGQRLRPLQPLWQSLGAHAGGEARLRQHFYGQEVHRHGEI